MKSAKKFYLYNKEKNITTPLGPREVECIIYILRGKTSKQIARMLDLSHRTIEFYIGRLRTKLYCHSKSDLIEKILSGQLVNQEEPESSQAQLIQDHRQIDSIIKQLEREKPEKKEEKNKIEN